MEIELKWSSADLSFLRNKRLDRALLSALSRAGSKAARAMKAASTREVRGRRALKVKRVNNALPLTFPKARSLSDLQWVMRVQGNPIPLEEFPHTQTGHGVRVRIAPGAGKTIKSAFEATMRSGHTGIFKREGKGRLPIEELFTTSLSSIFNKDEGMRAAIMARTQAVFKSSFDQLLPAALKRLK